MRQKSKVDMNNRSQHLSGRFGAGSSFIQIGGSSARNVQVGQGSTVKATDVNLDGLFVPSGRRVIVDSSGKREDGDTDTETTETTETQ